MFEELRTKLRELMNDLADTVAGGGAQNFEDYRFMVGKIEGLAHAERLLLDILERIETLND